MEGKKVTFKKIGGGSFRTKNGKIIKPNQVFEAFPRDIPEAFRDTIVRVDGVTVEAEKKEEGAIPMESVVQAEYRLVDCGRGWFDVYRGNKRVNEKRLRKDDASQFIKESGGVEINEVSADEQEEIENQTPDEGTENTDTVDTERDDGVDYSVYDED